MYQIIGLLVFLQLSPEGADIRVLFRDKTSLCAVHFDEFEEMTAAAAAQEA